MTDPGQPSDDREESVDVELVPEEVSSDVEPAGPITAFNRDEAWRPIIAFNRDDAAGPITASNTEILDDEGEDPDGGS